MPGNPIFVFAVLICLMASVSCAYEHAGNITDWNLYGTCQNEITFNCTNQQIIKINILTDNIFRVRFSADGSLPASRMIGQWNLVRSNNGFPTPTLLLWMRKRLF